MSETASAPRGPHPFVFANKVPSAKPPPVPSSSSISDPVGNPPGNANTEPPKPPPPTFPAFHEAARARKERQQEAYRSSVGQNTYDPAAAVSILIVSNIFIITPAL